MLSEFFFSNSEREEQDDSSLAREQSREKVAEITEGMAAHTYKSVLSLAVWFKIEKAVDLAEQYLIKTLKLRNAEKLLIAEQSMLESLKEHCFNSLNTLAEMKKMKAEEEFAQLPASMKAALLNKAFELIN
ncbi:hypothetical protein PRIPAC_83450 [Pristionchus pacificus]|uniref:Uncharacterized protein n=1 Tax=Pristionchus pacificus TaxID=54126 RepID=A0A2A6CC41_PRIPA|nr:hypothetical protein PRIPAC_83450 [Pristionchus pacificus]|eukprot:PDM75709.1 hypothetical protein PRIPAC_40088 [Pristionchus pacificus]